MARRLHQRKPPGRWLRALLRAPIGMYSVGLGGLLGQRFLLLNHKGAKTGLPRRTVLEVVEHDAASDTYYIAVGFGPESHWFKNLQKTPDTDIRVGWRRLDVHARPLSQDEGDGLMQRYAQRNPKAARALAKFMGFEVDGSVEDYAQLPALGLQFVALEPRAAAQAS